MADLIKKIKIKKQDGTFTDYIPIGAEAQNIATSDGDSVQLKLNKKPYYYNSVVDMKADLKLKAGDMAITLGYYNANDGGASEYKIVSTTSKYAETLNNNLKAELIIKNEINVKQFGAYGDGAHDDTNALQNAIDYSNDEELWVKGNRNDIYLISNTLTFTNRKTSLDLNNATIRCSLSFPTGVDAIIHINIPSASNIDDRTQKYFKNFTLDCQYTLVPVNILITWLQRTWIEHVNVINAANTVLRVLGGYEIFFDKWFISCKKSSMWETDITNTVGLDIRTSDLLFSNFTAIDCKTFLKANSSSNYYDKIHAWIATRALLIGSRFAEQTGSTSIITNSYADTYESVFVATGADGNFKINGFHTFFNTAFWGGDPDNLPANLNPILFVKDNDITAFEYTFAKTSVRNSNFWGNNSTDNKHLDYKLCNIANCLINADSSVTFDDRSIDMTDSPIIFTTVQDLPSYITPRQSDDIKFFNRVQKEGGLTHVYFNFDIDYTNITAGQTVTVGYIKYMPFSATFYSDAFAMAVNPTTQDMSLVRIGFDQGNNTLPSTDGRIFVTVSQDMITKNCTRIYIDTTIRNFHARQNHR